ncbi:MAG: sigma-54-dependent Fis family transcriptional regulator [Myxococcales bacterium]|nr:sigma-54-dependent Fis family transcriptional regulator [Myxococcales bacterium]
MAEGARLLLIDDGEAYAKAIRKRLGEHTLLDPLGDAAHRLPDGPAALDWLAANPAAADVVLLDMRFDVPAERLLPLPEATTLRRQRRFQGVAILRALRERWPGLPVVVLTAVEDLALVDAGDEVAGLSLTYVLDSDDLDTLRIRIQTALIEAQRGGEEGAILWGRDPAMTEVRRRLRMMARGRMPVILEGETGTGKSYLAERLLHAASGRKGAFVVLDLSTVPTDLIPAHLFGARRGAYTGAVADRQGVFELADGGTLFIDEIQNVPLEVQKQLLLVLQDRKVRPLGASKEVPVDVKVVAASNAPLAQAVRAGRFRPDLYMRLSPATRVVLPPLRTRPEDLAFLAQRFVGQALADPDLADLRDEVARGLGLGGDAPVHLQLGREPDGQARGLLLMVPAPAWKRLLRHPWPGNLRELAMVVRNIVTFTLVAAVEALSAGAPLRSNRLQVDAGLIDELLAGAMVLPDPPEAEEGDDPEAFKVRVEPQRTLNAVSTSVERQYFLALYRQVDGDFGAMAERLLGDRGRGRAIRLRLNQLGLKVRDLKDGG